MAVWDLDLLPVETLRWRLAGAMLSGPAALAGRGQTAEISGGGWWTCELNNMDVWSEAQWQEYLPLILDLFGGVETVEVPIGPDLVGCRDVLATVTTPAALRATTVELTATAGTIRPGAVFGLDHATAGARGYYVRQILSETAGVYSVKILPPIREAVADNAAVDFATPRCTMQLDDAAGDAWPTIDSDLSARPSLRFSEAFS